MRPEPNPYLVAALAALSVIAACTQAPPTNAVPDAALASKTARINSDATPARYINGMWYTISGDDILFERGSRCQMDGLFVADCLDTAVMIDLENGYVIPALGDAHNHNVDGPWTADRAKTYMSNGVFYMRNLNSVVSIDKWAASAWEGADTLDIAWAHAGISVDEGHPEKLYRNIAGVYRLDPESLEGDVFWDAPDIATLEEKWPRILETRPDWIKLFLIFTEDEGKKPLAGLDRDVFARAVELAKASNLQTAVHVNTAEDFATAIRLGADQAAHLPPTFIKDDEPDARYLLTPEMARAAAKARFVTTPTAALIESAAATPERADDKYIARTRNLQAQNLRTLRAAGAPIALGSDLYDGDAVDEYKAIAARDVYTPAELLRIAVETPSNSIFPNRAIGTLKTGWEASFLVLECDPTADTSCIEKLKKAVKQGTDVDLAGPK